MGVRIKVQSLWPKAEASTFVYEFAQSRVVIGRSRSADVQLPHVAVSGTHASIRTEGAGYALLDEGSTNGTRVNDALLVPGRAKILRPNDTIDLGGYRMTVELGVPVAQTMSSRLAADFAKQMLGEQVGDAPSNELDSRLAAVQRSGDERVELLPIPRVTPSVPPPARESRPSQPRTSKLEGIAGAYAAPKLTRSEIAVYLLAGVVVLASVVAMALLMGS